ncbi:MAG: hypothetical protein BWX86_01184 [Verrucomicrobia bacterium ADurb.Bin122]|nr:MAG: hypothetical protein BWX86_01184 [Verrucomicrobia bacterium ADurb.Bin122]
MYRERAGGRGEVVHDDAILHLALQPVVGLGLDMALAKYFFDRRAGDVGRLRRGFVQIGQVGDANQRLGEEVDIGARCRPWEESE